ncbi:DUF58 domain-containing protein [Pseudoxanthomonas broegbernensis]|uniref:DUF58 domain-containing protein n=1 Tax=Pseudoxanthomonas broegbernensis TaxID=83619 RepID=A0A7V8GLA5_9GAMM|nr:DUF58 domain-containing protein [Pseudoxanthomonas broegbernensis]KAF1685691.1 DUF58 domain-containing protein [Pseudoxanthomonas broegbernensis]MBB6066037.1 uncharacterized protein (DUF58 family) [Pseudoxanthomonas broegbernensis]
MRPAPPLLALLGLCGLAGLMPALGLVPVPAWWALVAAIALLAAVDGLRLVRSPTPAVVRMLPDALAVGVAREVEIALESRRRLRVDAFDLHPPDWQADGLPRRLRLPAASLTRFRYRLLPAARGRFVFEGAHLRLHSPWRLWTGLRTAGTAQEVRVYPDFAPLARLALFSAEQASLLVGAHLRRRRGEGTDFRQMREYRVGDSLRQVDWKATARARKLISREYQDERNQQLLLVVDTGRRMLASEGGLSHFDHALNAALVVAWLALRQGDAVGLMATGADPRWVRPRRGPAALQGLLRDSYDLQPRPVATDYLAMAEELSLRQRRRALVMLATNVRDEDADDLLAAVRLLQRRHLVCVASLRERELDEALAREVDDLPGAIAAGATARYLAQRAQAHDALRRQRVMTLDVAAAELPAALVERYLAVKRDGLL